MKQRALMGDGDYAFGTGLPFLADTPLCVAQAIMTRLRLAAGEWFLDTEDGTPYDTEILGHNTAETRDLAVRARILDTPGVVQINEYLSFLDGANRSFNVVCIVETLFGPATVVTSL